MASIDTQDIIVQRLSWPQFRLSVQEGTVSSGGHSNCGPALSRIEDEISLELVSYSILLGFGYSILLGFGLSLFFCIQPNSLQVLGQDLHYNSFSACGKDMQLSIIHRLMIPHPT